MLKHKKLGGKQMQNPPAAGLRRQVETKIVRRRQFPKSNLLLLGLKTGAIDDDVIMALIPDYGFDNGADGRPEGRR